jgi:hypothetical protein
LIPPPTGDYTALVTHMFSIRFWFVLVVGLFVSGCNQLECGIGTYESLGTCIPSEQTLCGDGTVYERGYCVIQDAQRGPTTSDVNEDIRDIDGNED